MRRVKIVATLGPATSTPERIRELLLAGVDVVRMNFSHGSHQEHERLIHIVRQVAGEMERPVAVLQDLQGPRIRTRGIPDGKLVELVSGQEFLLGPGGVASTTYPDLYRVVGPGQRILLDDGRMEVRVVAVAGQQVRCQVVNGGLLGISPSRKCQTWAIRRTAVPSMAALHICPRLEKPRHLGPPAP